MSPYHRSKSVTSVNLTDSKTERPTLFLRDLLSGKGSLSNFKLCNTEELEKLLARVLRMHSANELEAEPGAEGRPPWWPNNVVSVQAMRGFQERVHDLLSSWHSTLASVLNSCVEYYSQEGKQQELNTFLKRKASSQSSRSPGASSSAGECSAPKRIRLKSIDLNMSFSPVVLLEDVLKTKNPVIEKENFMNFLQLQRRNANPPARKLSKTMITRSKRYPYKLPFSSRYGQQLNTNDNFKCTHASHARNRDSKTAHLPADSRKTREISVAESNFEVTHKPKKGAQNFDRKYSFSRRRCRQRGNAVERLKQAICRPVEVRIKRINIEPYLLKKKFCRRVSVCLDNRKTD